MSASPDTLRLTDDDLYLFNEGSHLRLYEKLGAHLDTEEGTAGCRFAVWAPNARTVSVVGDFNGWKADADTLEPVGGSGIWAGFVPGVAEGARYKYRIVSRRNHARFRLDTRIRPKCRRVRSRRTRSSRDRRKRRCDARGRYPRVSP